MELLSSGLLNNLPYSYSNRWRAGLLAGWLADWTPGWLTGRMAGRTPWLAGWLNPWLADAAGRLLWEVPTL